MKILCILLMLMFYPPNSLADTMRDRTIVSEDAQAIHIIPIPRWEGQGYIVIKDNEIWLYFVVLGKEGKEIKYKLKVWEFEEK